MNDPLTGHEPPAPAKKRRGLTIGHWLLIVIFVAVCVDIGIRILAYRKLQASVALRAAENRTTQQLLDSMRKNFERIDVLRSQSKKSIEDFERLQKQWKATPEPQDSSKGNIIPLLSLNPRVQLIPALRLIDSRTLPSCPTVHAMRANRLGLPVILNPPENMVPFPNVPATLNPGSSRTGNGTVAFAPSARSVITVCSAAMETITREITCPDPFTTASP
jgi:hypothetical protein